MPLCANKKDLAFAKYLFYLFMRRQPSTVALLLRSVEGTRISDSFGSGSPEPFMFVLTDSIHGGLLSTFRGKEICRYAQTKRTSLLRSTCYIFLCDAEPSTASIQLQPVEGLRFIGCFATRTPFDSFSLTLNLSVCCLFYATPAINCCASASFRRGNSHQRQFWLR